MFAVRFRHGFCHAAAGAAIHLRATPVLKASVYTAQLFKRAAATLELSGQTRGGWIAH
jgi:hypothetical protein